METASNKIDTVLRHSGYRLTQARKEVASILCEASNPLSIQMLAKQVKADEASVYRTVALLLELGLIEEIVEQGKVRRYAITHSHHHHIVCRSCGYVEHIPCKNEGSIDVRHQRFSSVDSHEVTYYGHCKSCV